MEQMEQSQQEQTELTDKQKVKELRAKKKQEQREQEAKELNQPTPAEMQEAANQFSPTPEPGTLEEALQRNNLKAPEKFPMEEDPKAELKRLSEMPTPEQIATKERQELLFEADRKKAKLADLRSQIKENSEEVKAALERIGSFAKFFTLLSKWGEALGALDETDALKMDLEIGFKKSADMHGVFEDALNAIKSSEDIQGIIQSLKEGNGNSRPERRQEETQQGVGEAPAAEQEEIEDPDFREVEDGEPELPAEE